MGTTTAAPTTAAPEKAAPRTYAELFTAFHQRANKAPFSPEFLAHLVAIMADESRDIDERTLAWSRFRSWANYNEYACRGKGDGRPLKQRDCAVDLAHFAAGRPAEWIDLARENFSPELTPKELVLLDKSCISRSFARNKDGGFIDIRGHRIYPVVDPAHAAGASSQVNTPPKFSGVGNFYQIYISRPEVANSREFRKWRVARARAEKWGKVVLTNYREWLRAERKAQAKVIPKDLEEVEEPTTTPEPPRPAADLVVVVGKQGTEPPAEKPPAEVEIVAEALNRYGAAPDKTAASLIEECRKHTPDASAREIATLIDWKADQFSEATRNPVGLLLRTVPALCGGSTLNRVRKRLAAVAEQEATTAQKFDDPDAWAEELRAALRDPSQANFHDVYREQLEEIERRRPKQKESA
jgi:hypothetical protein